MIQIDYQKRKNTELFKKVEDPGFLFLSNCQNYIPIYTKFFSLHETNCTNVNLNHKNYIINLVESLDDNVFICKIKNSLNDKVSEKQVFFKLAPLLDPFKYMAGKYDVTNPSLFQLPALSLHDCHPKLLDVNNCAYVDGFFLYLSSQLFHKHKFIHGIDYYGSFLAIKNDFKINVFDDLEYLQESDFFNKHKHSLFQIDECQYLFDDEPLKLKPIHIGNNISLKSVQSVDHDLFQDIFDTHELEHEHGELIDVSQLQVEPSSQMSIKSGSSCSSRSSYTDSEVDDSASACKNCPSAAREEGKDDEGKEDDTKAEEEEEKEENDVNDKEEDEDEEDGEEDELDEEEDEVINVTIPKFPVQVIGMECCENTFDDLILSDELTDEQWLSALMQVIMILITYQKAFQFTHNDLHTNNIMYNKTTKKYLYYCYNKKYYRVPTFGRVFKIIDFGRSIFRFGKLFCSDSFQNGGDAATQYNTEPYFNDKKPRLEPNFSFDLCRLACSIFDYIMDDFEEMKHTNSIKNPVKKIIYEWCLDDKKINMLYKNNGTERYPEFKLYKMIARCVHNHTPQLQLERPEFSQYEVKGFERKNNNHEEIMNIDSIPSYI